MQKDFHYYACFCAAHLAGFSPEEALTIAWSNQFTDCCTRTFLSKYGAPLSAATTQLQMEMMDADTGTAGLQDITRIWASFHFLPQDLNAEVPKGSKKYRSKYRLICGPNGALVKDIVERAKGESLEAAGLAMHVLSDTWAHSFFAGTPSYVINDTNYDFIELVPADGGDFTERPVSWKHIPGAPDEFEKGVYINTVGLRDENSIMNLGHGRAGHLPDYSCMRYRYMPAWADYREVLKDNPADYESAFGQMVRALQYLRGVCPDFETEQYAEETVDPWRERIRSILEKRQEDACADWKAFGEELTGLEIPEFSYEEVAEDYRNAPEEMRDETTLGKYLFAALAHKSLVTNKIFTSGSRLAGISLEVKDSKFRGNRDFRKLLERAGKFAERARKGGSHG